MFCLPAGSKNDLSKRRAREFRGKFKSNSRTNVKGTTGCKPGKQIRGDYHGSGGTSFGGKDTIHWTAIVQCEFTPGRCPLCLGFIPRQSSRHAAALGLRHSGLDPRVVPPGLEARRPENLRKYRVLLCPFTARRRFHTARPGNPSSSQPIEPIEK